MRKGRKNPVIAVAAAVFAAVLAACLAASALYAPATSSMYVNEETFSGEVEEFNSEENDSASGHKHTYYDWYSLNTYLTQNTEPAGWTREDTDEDGVYDTVTFDVSNKNLIKMYYLSDDLTCDIKIMRNDGNSNPRDDYETVGIFICLNGHVLRGTGKNPVIYANSPRYSSRTYPVEINILDCGGSCYGERHYYLGNPDESYDYNHYYMYEYDTDSAEKYGTGVVDGEEVPVRYEFIESDGEYYYVTDENGDKVYVTDDEGNPVTVEGGDIGEFSDGCVRGGLICGGYASTQQYAVGSSISMTISAGGILVLENCVLNMYGGTIAGNSTAGSQVDSLAGGVGVSEKFNMYGGTIEGNGGDAWVSVSLGNDRCAGGVGLTTRAEFNMYGGEIKNNFTLNSGGGVGVIGYASSTSSNVSRINMYGGTIEGNYAGYYGGGVFVSSRGDGNAEFNMYGGTIRDNFAEEGGGGIEATRSAYVSIVGGTVSGNRVLLDGSGGGIYISGSSTLTLGGSSYVYDNHYGNYLGEYGDGRASEGRTSNIEWSSDWVDGSAGVTPVINLSGELEEGARIGISPVTGSSGDVVYRYKIVLDKNDSGHTLSDYVKYFFADGQGMSVRLVTEDGEEYLEIYDKR